MNQDVVWVSNDHGLCCHSSAVSERKRVLDEILAIPKPHFNYGLEESGYNWLVSKIEELREKVPE